MKGEGRRRSRRLALVILLAAAVVWANLWASSTHAQVDLSAERRFSLTPETRGIIRAVHERLRISVFLNLEAGQARDARFLLARYHELNRHVTTRFVDPDQQPGEARRLGVTGYATVVLQYRGRRVDAATIDEVQISSAILRLVRGGTRTVCFVTGHGEPSLGDGSAFGLSKLKTMLEHNAYRPRVLDLARAKSVPSACALAVVVAPTVALSPAEVASLTAYARAGGGLFVAASPGEVDPNPLLRPWGIAFLGGVVADEARNEGLDPSNLIIESFPTESPVVDGVPRLQFPFAGALGVHQKPAAGLSVSRLAQTSDRSFVETNPDQGFGFDPGDVPGPVLVAAAADQSRVERGAERRLGGSREGIVRTRVFVSGSSVWLTNQLLDHLGNRRFATNALAWLAEEEQVLTAPSGLPAPRELPWTPERQLRVALVAVVGVPGGVLALGGVLLVVARRREGRDRSGRERRRR